LLVIMAVAGAAIAQCSDADKKALEALIMRGERPAWAVIGRH
jgi:hypothetical protein